MARKCVLYVCNGAHPGNFVPSDGMREFLARIHKERFVQVCPVCGEEMKAATEQDEVILVSPADRSAEMCVRVVDVTCADTQPLEAVE